MAAGLAALGLAFLAARGPTTPAPVDAVLGAGEAPGAGPRRTSHGGHGVDDEPHGADPTVARTGDASRPPQRRDGDAVDRRTAHEVGTEHGPADTDPSLGSADAIEALRDELEALRRDHAELREEHAELLGKPVATPPTIEPRHTAPVLTTSVRQAIGQSGVGGDVEHVDCDEYPCIVYGRLVGDEEDMEEIERAAALSEYDADVLTLLFWATTADSSEAAGPRETGLFAIAFYTFEDRAEMGAELDRRIRGRTVEYWNADEPGRPTAAAVD